MAYWSFSDVFEEQGVVRTPFYGGFGLIAADNIPKASYNDFLLLHKLGTKRLRVNSDSALATKDTNGNLVLALWNYAPPAGTGPTYTAPTSPTAQKSFQLHLDHLPKDAHVKLWRVDETHANAVAAFDAMGRPPGDLTRKQVADLKLAGALTPPESLVLTNGMLQVNIPAHGLVLLQVDR